MSVRGPFFAPNADAITQAAVDGIEKEIAQVALDRVESTLRAAFKHPTGRYVAHVRERARGGDEVVTDSGIVYGPWLEGRGSRNRSTRFKGYAAFRRTTAVVEIQVPMLADTVVSDLCERLS